jgi:hypothetical protein
MIDPMAQTRLCLAYFFIFQIYSLIIIVIKVTQVHVLICTYIFITNKLFFKNALLAMITWLAQANFQEVKDVLDDEEIAQLLIESQRIGQK